MINRVKTFTEKDCNKIEKLVDNLHKLWVNRSCTRRFSYENSMKISKAPFWTLGAVSYLDAVTSKEQYDKHRDYLNPVLHKKFNWIYEIIRERLQSDLKEPVVIDEFLAHPGFHIFATKTGSVLEPEYMKMFEQPLGSVHVDVQYEEHIEYWKTFKEVVFPLIAPSIIGIALFGFTLSYDELARSSQVMGAGNTLPLELKGLTTTVTTPVIYALGTVTTFVSFSVIGISIACYIWLKRKKG